jgi:hypothetical protein
LLGTLSSRRMSTSYSASARSSCDARVATREPGTHRAGSAKVVIGPNQQITIVIQQPPPAPAAPSGPPKSRAALVVTIIVALIAAMVGWERRSWAPSSIGREHPTLKQPGAGEVEPRRRASEPPERDRKLESESERPAPENVPRHRPAARARAHNLRSARWRGTPRGPRARK